MLVCPNCFNIFVSKNVKSYWTENGELFLCPNVNCPEIELAEIDDLLCDIISKLWSLGVVTEYCCSGHFYEEEGVFSPYIDIVSNDPEFLEGIIIYISFIKEKYKRIKIEKTEDSFEDEKIYKVIIKAVPYNESLEERIETQNEFIKLLYEWYEKLLVSIQEQIETKENLIEEKKNI